MNTNHPDLESCPFCGGDAHLRMYDEDEWGLECQTMDCGVGFVRYATKQLAAAAWNRRVKPSAGTATREIMDVFAYVRNGRPSHHLYVDCYVDCCQNRHVITAATIDAFVAEHI